MDIETESKKVEYDRPPRRVWPRVLAVAACLAAALMAGKFFDAKRPLPTAVALAAIEKLPEDAVVERASSSDANAVFAGDRITTGKTGVTFRYPDDSSVSLDPGSIIQFDVDVQTGGKRLTLKQGRLSALVSKQPIGKSMMITAPEANAEVSVGKFTLATGNAKSRLAVDEHEVSLSHLGTGKSIVVSADCCGEADAQGRLALTRRVFNAAEDFSQIQSDHGWSYLDSLGKPMVFGSDLWKGSEDYLSIWGDGAHPGDSLDAVLRWSAPVSGSIHISGEVYLFDKGSGITFTIRCGGLQMWQKTIGAGDQAHYEYGLATTVETGTDIEFVIDAGDATLGDSTYLNPTIILLP